MRIGTGSLADLARLRDFKRRRPSCWDRSGGSADRIAIAPGETAAPGESHDAGCVKHLWIRMTSPPPAEHERIATVQRMYRDGERSPRAGDALEAAA